jgi:DNA-directed RNA polymerase subunit beta
LKNGLRDAFEAISPITDFSGNLQLELEFDPDDPDLKSPPKFTVEECRQRATTYSAPIFVRARFLNANTGEIKEQTVFMGDFPIMTDQGTFIINGTERVVVSQLVRSPGVIFQPGKDEKVAFEGTIHPSRGEWLQVDLEEKKNKAANAGARIARKRRISLFTLLRALDQNLDESFFEKFVEHFDFLEDQYHDDWKKALREINAHIAKYNYDDNAESVARASQETAWLEIYRRARPGEVQTIEAARQYFEGAFFSEKRYDLSRVGRYKLDRKLGTEVEMNRELFGDILDRPNEELHVLSKAEVLATATYLLNLARDRTAKQTAYHIDDQDHFANRRIRSVGELIQNAGLRTGLSRMERVVRERMTTQDVEAITPQTLINIRPVVAAIKEFFGDLPAVSQFMDQNNPLSGLTHKRRLSALGPGGLGRERAGFEVRDVHPSHYGRMCPIETPEGPNIGLIGSLATLRPDQRVRLHRDAVPQVVERAASPTRSMYLHRRRGGAARHRSGQRRSTPTAIRPSASSCAVARPERDFASEPRTAVVDHREIDFVPARRSRAAWTSRRADHLGGHRADSLRRARRRQPRARWVRTCRSQAVPLIVPEAPLRGHRAWRAAPLSTPAT